MLRLRKLLLISYTSSKKMWFSVSLCLLHCNPPVALSASRQAPRVCSSLLQQAQYSKVTKDELRGTIQTITSCISSSSQFLSSEQTKKLSIGTSTTIMAPGQPLFDSSLFQCCMHAEVAQPKKAPWPSSVKQKRPPMFGFIPVQICHFCSPCNLICFFHYDEDAILKISCASLLPHRRAACCYCCPSWTWLATSCTTAVHQHHHHHHCHC